MIVKIKNLENKMEKMQESITKDLEELKNKHTEANNTITEIKNTLERINSKISEAEQINELEDKMVEITSEEQNEVKRMRITDSLRDLWDNIKCTTFRIIGVPEEEKKKGHEKIFEEIIVENFPNMEKEIVNQVQEAAAAAAKSLQSYPTLCDPIDGSPPGSPVPGILQARILEWVSISFSNA